MRQIFITDVNKRFRSLSRIDQTAQKPKRFNEGSNVLSSIRNKQVYDVKRLIESYGKQQNQEIPFMVVMELFDSICKKGTASEISKMGSYICEEIMPKVRDAKAMQTNLRYKLTRLRHKNQVVTAPNSTETSPTIQKTTPPKSAEAAEQQAYEKMAETAEMYIHCDRVLENYNRVSKRFNLESIIIKNAKSNGIYDTVIELCKIIDTYDMPIDVKFNTVIESTLYGFESNYIKYNPSDILEAAVDYFAFKEGGLLQCKNILEHTLFYDKDTINNIKILAEEVPENNSDRAIDTSLRRYCASDDTGCNIKESAEFKDIFDKFKKEELAKDGKPEGKLRQLITKLYSRDVDSIVEDTPSLLSWIRTFFIVGSCAIPIIGPVLMLIGYIADRFISLHMDVEETQKMIACFNNEIKAANKKLEGKISLEDRNRIEQYIKSLETAKSKIEDYRTTLGADELSASDDDLDFDDDFSFDEMAKNVENIITYNSAALINESLMFNIPSKLNNTDMIYMANIVCEYPKILHKDSFLYGLESELRSVRNSKDARSHGMRSDVNRSIRLNSINEAIEILNKRSTLLDQEADPSIYEAAIDLDIMNEVCNAITIIQTTPNTSNENILEASFSNSLKMASLKLKDAMKKVSGKEKNISKSVDLVMNNLLKSVERSLTSDNREAIIKGSILPSASKIIKLGLANAGLLILHQPVVAVIATLGYLASSAKFKAKERQMLIDEIEIELKMCEKYIDIAEQKNDMKALKQLLTDKRELERQLQRVKYKMRVDMGQKYYDAKHIGES